MKVIICLIATIFLTHDAYAYLDGTLHDLRTMSSWTSKTTADLHVNDRALMLRQGEGAAAHINEIDMIVGVGAFNDGDDGEWDSMQTIVETKSGKLIKRDLLTIFKKAYPNPADWDFFDNGTTVQDNLAINCAERKGEITLVSNMRTCKVVVEHEGQETDPNNGSVDTVKTTDITWYARVPFFIYAKRSVKQEYTKHPEKNFEITDRVIDYLIH